MKPSLAVLFLVLGLFAQARAQLQAQLSVQAPAQDGEDRERTRREMREAMRSERERWRENATPVQGWSWRPPSPRHWEGHDGRLTPQERRELRNLLEETARERRALAAERGAELVPIVKGSER
jgi:hypothetical protein